MKLVILLFAFFVNSVAAQQESNGVSKPRGLTLDFGDSFFDRVVEQEGTSKQDEAKQSHPKWQYGGFIDLAYPLNFNHPANHLFRSRGTAFRTARQTVKAFTSTVEYRVPYKWTSTIFRLEHRFDESRGPDGGFFRGAELSPGVITLTPRQHGLIFGTIFTFDSPAPE